MKREEGESFEDYKKRRALDNKKTKEILAGKLIKAGKFNNRRARRAEQFGKKTKRRGQK